MVAHNQWIFLIIIVALVFVIFSPGPYASSGAFVSGNQRPNILFIRTDDQDYNSMEARLPNGEFVMKNVKQMIEQPGTKFTKSFVSFPLCCPSRATALTGQYAHNTHVMSNQFPEGGWQSFNESSTLPLWLQHAGYYTLHVGKYLNGYDLSPIQEGTPPPPGWNQWYALLIGTGSDFRYYNYQIYDGQHIINIGSSPSRYQTDVLTQKVVNYLWQKPYGNRPFFLELDYMAPHAGPNKAVPAPRHLGMMNNTSLPMPPSFNEANVSDKPLGIQSLPLFTNQEIDNIKNTYQRRMETLLAVDEGVKKIIQTLDATHQLQNTIIVFTSDNGFFHGEHRVSTGKHLPYEPLQVPLLMRGPGIPQGVTINKIVVNIDYSPTILEWAGATPGLPQDGRSLIPLFANPTTTQWRKEFLTENPLLSDYVGLRTQNHLNGREYLYTEYDHDNDNVPDEKELYVLKPDECRSVGDPYLLESQHTNPCYTNLIQQFHQRLAVLKNCVGTSCQ